MGEVKYLMLCVSFVLCLIKDSSNLRCLQCRDVLEPRFCKTVVLCQSNELCVTRRIRRPSGEVNFSVGCADFCHNHTGSVCADGVCQDCIECCDTDLCNVRGCGQPDYPSIRGPVCYGCPQSRNVSRYCSNLEFCKPTEACQIIQQDFFGQVVYETKCQQKIFCKYGSSNIFGKRDSANDKMCNATRCCSTDLCNVPCSELQIYDISYECDFERDICDWTQGEQDNNNWILNEGRISSENTTYVYAPSSTSNTTAELISPRLPAYSRFCFGFSYYAHGPGTGGLSVDIKDEKNSSFRLLSKTADLGNDQFQHVQLDIPPQGTAFYIILNGWHRQLYTSTIAVERTKIESGHC